MPVGVLAGIIGQPLALVGCGQHAMCVVVSTLEQKLMVVCRWQWQVSTNLK